MSLLAIMTKPVKREQSSFAYHVLTRGVQVVLRTPSWDEANRVWGALTAHALTEEIRLEWAHESHDGTRRVCASCVAK